MRRRRVVFAQAARRDLGAIYEWIALEGSERTALGFVSDIERYCQGFDLASQRGQRLAGSRKHFRAVGYRRKATVVFEVLPDKIRIMRIFRAGRNWAAWFPGGLS